LLVAGDFNDWGTRVQRLLRVDALKGFEGERTLTYPRACRWRSWTTSTPAACCR
jgi:endonuclease/exonuclease/phosphatase (EEP) superfamily protein YafD